MPHSHFLLIVIVIIWVYKDLFKSTKMSKMLLRIGYVKLLIFFLFLKVI